MKNRTTLLFTLLTVFTGLTGFSQTAFRSIASGNWADFATTWERTANVYNPTPTWAVPTGAPTSNHIVIVRSGHTVALEASGKSSLNLIIETGGKLFANGNAYTIRVGVPSSGNGGAIDTLTVDGILGGAGELMPLELGSGGASLWIRGTGTIEIGRIRPNNNNVNYPGSGTANALPGARILIDKDIKLNVGNYALSALNSTPTANDSISVTILGGRTVTIANPLGTFHNDASTSVAAAGKYVYNINGTLDLTANTNATGGSRLMPFANAASSVTLNVNGLLKLGSYFKSDTITGNLGTVSLNIGNGGVVDGSQTSNMTVGSNGSNIYFKISGTGALKRTVPNDGTRVKFCVGTTSATPVYINGEPGPAEVFSVTLKDAFTHPAPANTLVKEWNITEATGGGNTDTLRFQWTTADQGASGFTGANPVFIGRWNGTAWEYTTALVSGTGTDADPYIARGVGFNTFGLFILSNTGTTPVALVNVKAYQKQNGIQVEFGNATESDILNYVIERSADGRSFAAAGTLLPKTNNGALNSYTYFDAAVNSGNNFYRVRVTERNGSIKYSNILNVRLSGNSGVLVYPNPVKGNTINIQLENLEKATYMVTLFNEVGQKVYTKQLNHDGRTASFTVELPASLKRGIYNLQVSSSGFKTIKNVVVE